MASQASQLGKIASSYKQCTQEGHSTSTCITASVAKVGVSATVAAVGATMTAAGVSSGNAPLAFAGLAVAYKAEDYGKLAEGLVKGTDSKEKVKQYVETNRKSIVNTINSHTIDIISKNPAKSLTQKQCTKIHQVVAETVFKTFENNNPNYKDGFSEYSYKSKKDSIKEEAKNKFTRITEKGKQTTEIDWNKVKASQKQSQIYNRYDFDYGQEIKDNINKSKISLTQKSELSETITEIEAGSTEKTNENTEDFEKNTIHGMKNKLKNIEKNQKTENKQQKAEESKKFDTYIQNAKDTSEIMVNIGYIFNKKDIAKVGMCVMATAGIAEGIAGACGIGAMAAMGPLGIANGIISGIAAITSVFRKEPQNDFFEKALIGIWEILNDFKKETAENFRLVFAELNEIKRQVFEGFMLIYKNQIIDREQLSIVLDKVNQVSDKIETNSVIIQDEFTSLGQRITIDNVSTNKTEFISKLRQIQMNDKDEFEKDVKQLIIMATEVNEHLSGFKDLSNTKRLLDRFRNLDECFNINTLIEFVKKYSDEPLLYLITPVHVKNYLAKNANVSVYEFIQTCTYDMIDDTFTIKISEGKKVNFVPVYNRGVWSLLVNVVSQNEQLEQIYYCYSTDDCFEKLFKLNPELTLVLLDSIPSYYSAPLVTYIIKNIIENNKQSFVEINRLEMHRITDELLIKYKTDLIDGGSKYNIQSVNNIVLFIMSVNELIAKIIKQKNSEGVYPSGLISGPMFENISSLVFSVTNYHDIVVHMKNPLILKKMLDDHNIIRKKIHDNLDQGLNRYCSCLKRDVELAFKTKITNLLSKHIEQFKKQVITIRTDYFGNWFSANNNHHTGKFCGTDSWSCSISNAMCGEQHQFRDAYQNHMMAQQQFHINNTIEYIHKIYDEHEDYFGRMIFDVLLDSKKESANHIGRPYNYIHPFVLPRTEGQPILSLVIRSDICDRIKFHPDIEFFQYLCGYAQLSYQIIGDKFKLFLECINGKDKYQMSTFDLDYDPLFYTGNEAIWWFWFGGNIPIDGSTNCYQRENGPYKDNRSTTSVWYPAYNTREHHNDVECEFPYNDIREHHTNLHKIMRLFDDKVTEYIDKYNQKIINRSFTPQLANLLDEYDASYLRLVAICKVTGIDTKILKYTSPYQYAPPCGVMESADIYEICKKRVTLGQYTQSANEKMIVSTLSYQTDVSAIISNIKYSNNFSPETWLETTQIEGLLIKTIKDISQTVTCRYSPSEQQKYMKDMTDILFVIFDIQQNHYNVFRGFDLCGFMGRVKKDFETKMKTGTLPETGFYGVLKQSVLALPDIDRNKISSHLLTLA